LIVGGLLLAAGYLPTLRTPFDFIDDGNLVYPSPGLTTTQHFSLWWERVTANVTHLGPFRPIVWIHWQITANVFGADPLAWRIGRLVWCGVAAGCLLWLLRELRVRPVAALVVAAAAMWNPSRNDIWTSLTLAEGVAMPYALLALIASRKASSSPRPWRWDGLALVSLLLALGCKNVYVALLPAMLFLRLLPDGVTFRDGWRANRARAAIYLLPMLLPIAHFVYIKLHPQPCHYGTPGPTWEQAGRFLSWFKGAAGLDYLGAGMAIVLGVLFIKTSPRLAALVDPLHNEEQTAACSPTPWRRGGCGVKFIEHRAGIGAALLLLISGFIIYLPVAIMTGRYTMPAVWGMDVLFGLMLTALGTIRLTWLPRVAWGGVGVGLVLMTVANVSRQDKLAARSRLLWEALEHVEQTAPKGTIIAWVGGASERGELNTEEGIHFYWHLLNRGRGDLHVSLWDPDGQPVRRVELPRIEELPNLRITAQLVEIESLWQTERGFVTAYHHGRRLYSCRVEVGAQPVQSKPTIVVPLLASELTTPSLDPAIIRLMRDSFGKPVGDADALDRLLGKPASNATSTAELLGGTANKRE